MTDNPAFTGNDEDGAVVVSIPVPPLHRTNSAPSLLTTPAGEANTSSKTSENGEKGGKDEADGKKEMTKAEILKQYRLHFFVGLIFFITVLSVSLSWHFRNLAVEQLKSNQAIFFNPRSREITLTDPKRAVTVAGILGKGIPQWHLPLHCPMVIGANPESKECIWKKTAILRIENYGNADVHCYNISWESLSPTHVPYDCYEIGNDLWYGPTNQSNSTVPIKGQFEFNPEVYSLGNNGIFSSAVDFYWLSFSGNAIYINGENPIRIKWNVDGDKKICFMSNYSGPLYHKAYNTHLAHLNYTICSGFDIKKTHLFMQSMVAPPEPELPPPAEVFQGPHWSVRDIYQTDAVSQQYVTDLVNNLTSYGFQHNTITLDGNWQEIYGDLVFDEARFPNMTELSETLLSNDFQLTLSVNPYFQYKSRNFHNGVVNTMFVKDAGGEVTGLTNFRGGLSAIIDVFSEDGMTWFEKQLTDLLDLSGASSVRLTYGNGSWLPYHPHFQSENATPNSYRRTLTEKFGKLSQALIVEHTSDSRHVTSLIPVVTDVEVTNNKLCLQGVIETALTLGLMGYPFIMVDGYRLSSTAMEARDVEDGFLPKELYIRWLQLATFFPAYQFSVAPWQYDDEVIYLARNLTRLHETLVLPEIENAVMKSDIRRGLPILRPVWWLNPTNHSSHESELVKSEFLIGDRLLVAPVLCSEVTSRDIFFPPGVWEDLHQTNVILGPSTLINYPVPLGEIAVFKRKKVVGENTDEL